MPDIDIDFADRQKILDVLPHTRATIWDDKGIKSHNTGVYFTDIPTIPGTDQSAFDHKVADQLVYRNYSTKILLGTNYRTKVLLISYFISMATMMLCQSYNQLH